MMVMITYFKPIKKEHHVFFLSDSKKKIPNFPYIKVKNVLHALEKIAANVRKKIKLDL